MPLKQLNLFKTQEVDFWKNQAHLVFLKSLNLRENQVMNLSLKISLGFILISFLALSFAWTFLPPQVPLIYSLPRGETQLVERLFLWLLPVGNLLVFLVNCFLTSRLPEEELFLKQILLITTSVVGSLSTITLIKIIFLVI